MEEFATCQNFTAFVKHVTFVVETLNNPDDSGLKKPLAQAVRASVQGTDLSEESFHNSMDAPVHLRRSNSLVRRSVSIESLDAPITRSISLPTMGSAKKEAFGTSQPDTTKISPLTPEPDQVGKPFLKHEDSDDESSKPPIPSDRRSRDTPEPPHVIASETSDM